MGRWSAVSGAEESLCSGRRRRSSPGNKQEEGSAKLGRFVAGRVGRAGAMGRVENLVELSGLYRWPAELIDAAPRRSDV